MDEKMNGNMQMPPMNGNMQMPPVYNQNMRVEKGDNTVFGIVSMCLGIASLFLFCTCINVALAVAGIIFGIIQIVKNKEKAFAIAGIVTSAVAVLMTCLFIAGLILYTAEQAEDDYYNYRFEDKLYQNSIYDDDTYQDLHNDLYDIYDFSGNDEIY